MNEKENHLPNLSDKERAHAVAEVSKYAVPFSRHV